MTQGKVDRTKIGERFVPEVGAFLVDFYMKPPLGKTDSQKGTHKSGTENCDTALRPYGFSHLKSDNW
jgi:hypothetical protein